MSDPYGDKINDDQARVLAYYNAMNDLSTHDILWTFTLHDFQKNPLEENPQVIKVIIANAKAGQPMSSLLVAKVAEMRMMK